MSAPMINNGFIAQVSERDDGMVVRPRSGQDVYLNKTAAYLFKILSENIECDIEKCCEIMSRRYPSITKSQIHSDVFASLKRMWELAIITYPGQNPFRSDDFITQGTSYRLFQATHDNVDSILHMFSGQVTLFDPYVDIPTIITKESLTYLFLKNLWICFILCDGDEVLDLIIYEKSASYLSTTAIINKSGIDMNIIELQKMALTSHNMIMTNIAPEQYPNASKLAIRLGMQHVGTLRQETCDGDVEVYYIEKQ